jgi:hypothetical protein
VAYTDKVLPLVHGGQIESVSVTPSGNAHVVFCDAAACKSFYDKHPNGIDLGKEKNLAIFVDLGREVDVVSFQLSLALSAGSTRVVRAVGVNINVTLAKLVKLTTGANRRLGKIIDTYVPGCVSQPGMFSTVTNLRERLALLASASVNRRRCSL